MKNLIYEYLKLLKKEDVISFGSKNNIFLSDDELNNIMIIAKRPDLLELQDYQVLEIIKKNMGQNNHEKVYSLYLMYKKKYQNYL